MGKAAGQSAAASPPRRCSRVPILRTIAQRFRGRPDSEHEMTINRLVIAPLILIYLLTSLAFGDSDVRGPLVTINIYSAFSIGFFVHILMWPGVCVPRRILAMCVDIGTLSAGIHVGNEVTSLLYPIYLWIIFGNGFRFGLKYLFLATALSLAGFGVVVAITDYWWSHLYLAGGLLGGLVILPLYAATLIKKLSAARQLAEEASQAKSRFLTSVSHELRTPLNAIIGLSDLLRDTKLDSDQQEMTRTIGTAGRSLLALINSILDLSRIEERRIATQIVEFDLHALLADVRAILCVQAHAKSVRLALHVTARTPQFIKADKRHLEEILVNLGGNAVKFTERGSVTIAIDASEQNGQRVRLRCEVTDTGIGIAPDAQGRIFESFTQADDTIIDRFGGTGLGLAIVKQLVEFHGGKIGVESAPGAGSTFWFDLPVEKMEPSAAALRAGVPVILLSDDAQLRDLLLAADADVRLAANPLDAR
jgi:two-component system sensor histidine kinase RpfC